MKKIYIKSLSLVDDKFLIILSDGSQLENIKSADIFQKVGDKGNIQLKIELTKDFTFE